MASLALRLAGLLLLSAAAFAQFNVGGIDAAVPLSSSDGAPPAEGLAVLSLMRTLDYVPFEMNGRRFIQLAAWHSLPSIASAEFVAADGTRVGPSADVDCPLGTVNARNFYSACFAVGVNASFINARSGIVSTRGGLTLTGTARGPALKTPSLSATFDAAINLTGRPVAFASLYGDNRTACGGPGIALAYFITSERNASAAVASDGLSFRLIYSGGALLSRFVTKAVLNPGAAGEATVAGSARFVNPPKAGRCTGGLEQPYWVPGFSNPCTPAAPGSKPFALLGGIPSLEVANRYTGGRYWSPAGERPLLAVHTTEFSGSGYPSGAVYGRFSPLFAPYSPLQRCTGSGSAKACSFVFPSAVSPPAPRAACSARPNPASVLFSLAFLNCAALSPAQLAGGASAVATAAGAAASEVSLACATTAAAAAAAAAAPGTTTASVKAAELPAASTKALAAGSRFLATFTPPSNSSNGQALARSFLSAAAGQAGAVAGTIAGAMNVTGAVGALSVAGLAGGLTQDILVEPAAQGNPDYYIGRESAAGRTAPSLLAALLAALLALAAAL